MNKIHRHVAIEVWSIILNAVVCQFNGIGWSIVEAEADSQYVKVGFENHSIYQLLPFGKQHNVP